MKREKVYCAIACIAAAFSLISCSSGGASGGTSSGEDATSNSFEQIEVQRLWRDAGFGLAANDEVAAGVFIAMDYVYDDRGANSNLLPGGDAVYPADGTPYFKNAADLVEVRVMPVADQQSLLLGVRFNTLVDNSIPVAAIGIGDGSASGKKDAWPLGAGIVAEGVRYVVTLSGESTAVTDLISGREEHFDTVVFNNTTGADRHLENTFSVILPMSAFDIRAFPESDNWTLYAAAGLWDGAQWVGGPFDVAFLEDTFTNWQNNNQADLIAGGDISMASASIRFADFPNRSIPIEAGRHLRIYPSPVSEQVGEGIVPWYQRAQGAEIENLNHYRGLYLPYVIWVPSESLMAVETPLFMFLHGASQTHLGQLQVFVDGVVNVPAFALSPTGAGELSFYKEEGEIDVLASMTDFIEHYAVDEDRVFLSGLSMGGQGTFSVGTHRPDLFAAAIPFIGTGQGTFNEDVHGDQQSAASNRWNNSTGRRMLENALNMPFRLANGATDPIVNISWPTQDVARMDELDVDHQFAILQRGSHNVVPEFQNALYHQVLDGCASASSDAGCIGERDSGGIRRDSNPARVRYKVVPFQFSERLGLRYEGAYWVFGMQVRELPQDLSFGLVDVTSFALAAKLDDDYQDIGTDPALVFEPTSDTYSYQGKRRVVSGASVLAEMSAEFTNLSAVGFDLQRAGLMPLQGAARIDVMSDGETSLTLSALETGTRVLLNGLGVGEVQGGSITFSVMSGASTIQLSR